MHSAPRILNEGLQCLVALNARLKDMAGLCKVVDEGILRGLRMSGSNQDVIQVSLSLSLSLF
jgi:hypothetical protein